MAGKIVDVPMDADLRGEFVSYVHRQWCESVDRQTQARVRNYDPVTDGDRRSYAASRIEALRRANVAVEKWGRLLRELGPYSPLIRGE